jgi:hypothetical protein
LPRPQEQTTHPISASLARARAITPATAPAASPRTDHATSERGDVPRARRERLLLRYDDDGAPREVILRSGWDGGRLVIDRDLLGSGRERLLATLAADEPSSNATVVCARYLEATADSRRCRSPIDADELPVPRSDAEPDRPREWSVHTAGFVHRLHPVPGEMSIPELRWRRAAAHGSFAPVTVSLRAAIALLESYEPLCAHTRQAVALHTGDSSVSITVLRTELERVLHSPIVLNRGLREAVLARVGRGETTMSEIAIRCGRLKRDPRGNRCGETSWLARRIGLLPEGGQRVPTPWVHSDVLALIARDGLGIAPREVELG